ncbi:MAG: hypothetical protein AAGF11_48560 [Myxococcota bacterium]
MTTGPETMQEAADDLGWGVEPGHLAALAREAEARHDFDVGDMRWGPWSPCPDWGASSWQCTGELHSLGDVLKGHVVVSEDHELVQTWRWRSNGREPAAWRIDGLREAAITRSFTAPKGHGPREPAPGGAPVSQASGGAMEPRGLGPRHGDDEGCRGGLVSPVTPGARCLVVAGSNPAGSTPSPRGWPPGEPRSREQRRAVSADPTTVPRGGSPPAPGATTRSKGSA